TAVINRQPVIDYLATKLYSINQQTKKVEREVPFTYSLDASEIYSEWESNQQVKVFIQGVVDCLLHQEEGVIIIDYKTDTIAESYPSQATVQTLQDKYDTQ